MKSVWMICVFLGCLCVCKADDNSSKASGLLGTFISNSNITYFPEWFFISQAFGIYHYTCTELETIAENPEEFSRLFYASQYCVNVVRLCEQIEADSESVPDPEKNCHLKVAAGAIAKICACGAESEIPKPQWGEWSSLNIGSCSVTCGSGVQRYLKVRSCDDPLPDPRLPGVFCDGSGVSKLLFKNCTKPACNKVDGGWGNWTTIHKTGCLATCGPSTFLRFQRRKCDSPAPANGGRPCEGSGMKISPQPCQNPPPCPELIHGRWGRWKLDGETECSVTCGPGIINRTESRDCNNPAPANGGRPCKGDNTRVFTRSCPTQLPCSGRPGDWFPWVHNPVSECSTTCGIGQQMFERVRKCNNPNNNTPCEGASTGGTVNRKCEVQPCEQPGCQEATPLTRPEIVQPCKYPFSIGLLRQGTYICGGFLLTPNRVLTAAHCVSHNKPETLQVEVGKHCASFHEPEFNPNMELISVRSVQIHEHFNPSNGFKYDLAILQLSEDVLEGPCRQVARIADTAHVTQTGRRCTVVSWGSLDHGGGDRDVLHKAEVEIYNYTDCQVKYPMTSASVDSKTMCASSPLPGGPDFCRGSSGAPLVCEDDGEMVVYGSVSSGFGCRDPRHTTLYMEMSSFYEWIVNRL